MGLKELKLHLGAAFFMAGRVFVLLFFLAVGIQNVLQALRALGQRKAGLLAEADQVLQKGVALGRGS